MPNFSPILLSKSDFYSYTGLTVNDVNDFVIGKTVDTLNSILNKELGELFNLQSDFSKYFQPTRSNIIFATGWWQRTGLIVSLVQNGVETVLDPRYYILKYTDDRNKIYGLILEFIRLSDTDEIKLTGTFGYSNGLPEELGLLSMTFYKMLKKAVLEDQNETENGGKGQITQSRIGEVATSFKNTDENKYTQNEKITLATLPDTAKQTIANIKSNYQITSNISVI